MEKLPEGAHPLTQRAARGETAHSPGRCPERRAHCAARDSPGGQSAAELISTQDENQAESSL